MITKIKNYFIDLYVQEATLGPNQLKRLAEHRYHADDQSFLTQMIFRYFWDWITNFYPFWLAPNVITFAGMIINAAATMIMLWYAPDCNQPIPRWTFLLCALSLFIYQTLDSTDGKQARRTNTSSPLGELFDHGCDSLTQVFLALQVSASLSLGDTHWGVMTFYLIAIYMFYAAHWQTYATGVLKFGKFDIIESQCVIIAILLTSAMFGCQVWLTEVFGITLRRIVLTPCFIMATYVCLVVLYTIYTEAAGENKTTVANTSLSFPILPIFTFLAPPTAIYYYSKPGVIDKDIVLFCLAFGMVSVKVTSRIILAHMTRTPLPMLDTVLLGPLAVISNQLLGEIIPMKVILWLCLIYGFSNLSYFACMTCYQICNYFKIDCFRIPYPSPAMKNGPTTNVPIKNGDKNVHFSR